MLRKLRIQRSSSLNLLQLRAVCLTDRSRTPMLGGAMKHQRHIKQRIHKGGFTCSPGARRFVACLCSLASFYDLADRTVASQAVEQDDELLLELPVRQDLRGRGVLGRVGEECMERVLDGREAEVGDHLGGGVNEVSRGVLPRGREEVGEERAPLGELVLFGDGACCVIVDVGDGESVPEGPLGCLGVHTRPRVVDHHEGWSVAAVSSLCSAYLELGTRTFIERREVHVRLDCEVALVELPWHEKAARK